VLWATNFPLTSSASISKESTYTQTILHYEETVAVTSTQSASMKYSLLSLAQLLTMYCKQKMADVSSETQMINLILAGIS
jgi:hypothetical protein